MSATEVQEAIHSLQNGKSPGPDGFTIKFFKTFSSVLTPILQRVYNEAFFQLPTTMSEASISLLLKKDKDPLLCSSYRPISLLNVDFKILSKILALRLQQVLPAVISPDQTGFMTGRHSFYNTRRLFNTILSSSSDTAEVILSLDAEKAFDRVEWGYLFFILNKFGFNSNFIAWIRLLYSSPVASVHTNATHSKTFPLRRGTRQGCPLSPLLFALAIEPLAIWLRSEERFEGITLFGTSYKLSLYADDLLLYITNPTSSLPPILQIFDLFGKFSGYRLNLQKSELFPVNLAAEMLSNNHFPFKWNQDGFRYLGVFITKSVTVIFRKKLILY